MKINKPSGKPQPILYWIIILCLFTIFVFSSYSQKLLTFLFSTVNFLAFSFLGILFYRYKSYDRQNLAQRFNKIQNLSNSKMVSILTDINGAIDEELDLTLSLFLPVIFCFTTSFVLCIKLESVFWKSFFVSESTMMLLLLGIILKKYFDTKRMVTKQPNR